MATIRFVLILALMFALNCSVPPEYARKMGWEVKVEEDLSKCPYERSLKSEYVQGGENDPKNPWRIFNMVMYHLARKKADTRPYEPPDVRDLVERLKLLHVTADSAEIISLYYAIFAPEDKQWDYAGNYYVDSVLYQRAQQILEEKGFDILSDDFNELGHYIIRHGPLEVVRRTSDDNVGDVFEELGYATLRRAPLDVVRRTYRITLTGAYLNATEDNYGSIIVSYVGIQDPESLVLDTVGAREARLRASTTISVPVPYDELPVNDVRITRYPCPASGAMTGPQYSSHEWKTQRLLTSVSIPSEKVTKDASLWLSYVIRSQNKNKEITTWDEVASGATEIEHQDAEDGATLLARVVSEPLPLGSYAIKVRVACGDKEHVQVRYLDLDNAIPLELAVNEPSYVLNETYVADIIPFFHAGTVAKDDTLTAFFPVGGLKRPEGSVYHEGEVYLLLYEPTETVPRIEISDYQAYPIGVEPKTPVDTLRGYPDGRTEYRDIFLFQDHVRLDYPNAALKVQFVLPEELSAATYMLGVQVFSRDSDGSLVDVGYGERPVQVR